MRLVLILSVFLLSPSVLAEPLEYAQKFSIKSKYFDDERTLRVSLPASYESNDKSRYPVIYVVRGQNDLLSVVASLDMLDSEAPEFIVVGIDGAIGDFFPNKDDSQTNFSRFIHDEVVSYVEENYRAAPYGVITGHSMAAIFVMHDWYERGDKFSKYIAISPPLDNGRLNRAAKRLSTETLKSNKPLLSTIANEGESANKGFEELRVTLASSAASFKVFPEQTHMSTRVNAMMHGLREAFPDWKPSKKIQQGSLGGLTMHYQLLSERYGFNIDVPLDTLLRMSGMGSMADNQQKNANAEATVKYVIARNAEDTNQLFDIASQLIDIGRAEGSKRLVSFICKEVPKDKRCSAK